MAFDSTIPHRYWNARTEPVRGIFFNLDRWQVADSGWDTGAARTRDLRP